MNEIDLEKLRKLLDIIQDLIKDGSNPPTTTMIKRPEVNQSIKVDDPWFDDSMDSL